MAPGPQDRSQGKRVQAMFQRIALRYDTFNTIATFGRDDIWRQEVARLAAPARVVHALDAATGTGKLALHLTRCADRVTAFDFADRMAHFARRRLHRDNPASSGTEVLVGDALAMPFRADSFDCATIAFGLRNVEDMEGCLRELLRVLKPAGRLVILEISRPTRGVQRLLYEFIFKRALPLVGWALTGDRSAYRYLPASVDSFPSPRELGALMASVGFAQVSYRARHLGTITLHLGVKPG